MGVSSGSGHSEGIEEYQGGGCKKERKNAEAGGGLEGEKRTGTWAKPALLLAMGNDNDTAYLRGVAHPTHEASSDDPWPG